MTTPDQRRARRVGAVLLAVSLAVVGVSSVFMALRIAANNRVAGPVPFATVTAQQPHFEYQGHHFALDPLPGAPPKLRVRWDDAVEEIPVTGIDNPALPGLMRYMDWLSVEMIVEDVTELQGLSERVLTGQVPSRLVLVARAGAPGHDPESWGAARYKDWVYTYLVLNPDGTITRSSRTYREVASDVRSWRHVAAMKVTGGLNTPSSRGVSPISYPNYAGVRDALDAMGWTWPASGAGALGALVGLIVLLGSYVQRPPAEGPDTPFPG